jgi:predicted membrane protein
MKNPTARSAAALLLLAAIILYRLCIGFQRGHLPWLENFSPVAAIALCGGIYLPRRLAIVVPLAALFISDLFLNWHYGYALLSPEMGSRYLALAASVAIGFGLRNRASLATVLPASLLGSVIFYVVTNTSSWLTWPAYSKTFSGWLQALWTGLPGYPPTWMFFRSTLLSDLLFSALFVFCMAATRAPGASLVDPASLTGQTRPTRPTTS